MLTLLFRNAHFAERQTGERSEAKAARKTSTSMTNSYSKRFLNSQLPMVLPVLVFNHPEAALPIGVIHPNGRKRSLFSVIVDAGEAVL